MAFVPGAATASPGDHSFYGQPRPAGFGKYIKRFGERRVRRQRPKAVPTIMGKKHKHLFERIVAPDNLWSAYRKAARGKRGTLGYLLFRQSDAANLVHLSSAISDGSYRPGEPRKFMVFEPKPREISALPFIDRVAQHALCNIIEPIFDQVFMPQSCACRRGRGTHAAAVKVQALLRQVVREGGSPWVLKTDFSKYFASVDLQVLNAEFRRKISCKKTLALLEVFVPPAGRGLPIGNLTSQLAANLYGHVFDRWLAHQVGIGSFVRYMDDVVIVGHSREAMALLQAMAEQFARSALGLRFSHWSIQPWQRGVNFCGYRIWPTHKLLRRSSVARARRKLAELEKGGDWLARNQFLAAWCGHAQWADSHNLMVSLGVTK